MLNVQNNGAVLYVRVSTDEQANGPLNLENQEQRCRDYCKQKCLDVIAVFVDPGESARSANRPAFQEMVQYCKANRQKVGFVIVQDLSRFARNLKDQMRFVWELNKVGVLLRSVYETNVDESPEGQMQAGIFGTMNEYFSNSLSSKMKDRTRASAAAGRYPWRAPIGYENIGGKIGANIRPDVKRAPLIRRAFELFATGRYKKSEVLKLITDEGLITGKGSWLSPQTFQQVLRNPLYAGSITMPSDPTFEPVRGLHEAIVSQSVFDAVQAILSGRKPSIVPKRNSVPKLPLMGFVKCTACGTPLTGGNPRGRSKNYSRYWCRTKDCRAVKLAAHHLEGEFLALLRRLRPTRETASRFPKIAAKVWAEKQGDADKQEIRLNARLLEQKKLKAELLKKNLAGIVEDDEYKEAKQDFDAEIAVTEQELTVVKESRAKLDAFVRFAELQLVDIAGAWRIAGPESRQRVQNLLFRSGLHYSQEVGILNRSKCSLFTMLEQMTNEEGLLASPKHASLNSLAEVLRQAQPLYRECRLILNYIDPNDSAPCANGVKTPASLLTTVPINKPEAFISHKRVELRGKDVM